MRVVGRRLFGDGTPGEGSVTCRCPAATMLPAGTDHHSAARWQQRARRCLPNPPATRRHCRPRRPQSPSSERRRAAYRRAIASIAVSGPPTCPRASVADLVVFRGSSTLTGTVNGSLIAFDAPVTISGRVVKRCRLLSRGVELRSGTEVTGDVVSQADPVLAPRARIGGQTRRVETHLDWQGFGWATRLALWLVVLGGCSCSSACRSWPSSRWEHRRDPARSGDFGGPGAHLRPRLHRDGPGHRSANHS
jgi:hypothetical protein